MTGSMMANFEVQPEYAELFSLPLEAIRPSTFHLKQAQHELVVPPKSYGIYSGSNSGKVTFKGKQVSSTTVTSARSRPIEETLFDALVLLKVSVSQYAMHIPRDHREDLFAKLDEILSVDNWYEEDTLPKLMSFTDFLKWIVYARFFNWSSLGVSDEGCLLVAIESDSALVTANFLGGDQIRWTAKIRTKEGIEYAAGKSHLKFFTKQVQFYLP